MGGLEAQHLRQRSRACPRHRRRKRLPTSLVQFQAGSFPVGKGTNVDLIQASFKASRWKTAHPKRNQRPGSGLKASFELVCPRGSKCPIFKAMVFRSRNLKYWVLGPYGCTNHRTGDCCSGLLGTFSKPRVGMPRISHGLATNINALSFPSEDRITLTKP